MAFLARSYDSANGVATAFPLSFPLSPQAGLLTPRKQATVYVRAVGDEGSPGTAKVDGVDFDWSSDSTITFRGGHVPANGKVVDIRRTTQVASMAATITPGGSLRAADVATNFTQVLNLIQERADVEQSLQAQLFVIDADLQGQIDDVVADLATTDASIEPRSVAAVLPHIKGIGSAQVSLVGNDIFIYAPQPISVDGHTVTEWPFITVTPEQFGAVGFPLSVNDAPALHSMGAALSAVGRGVGDCYPGRTYMVGGGQVVSPGHQAAGYSFPPVYDYVLELAACTGPVTLRLNGATFKCVDGVKYGTFNDDGTSKGTPPGSLTGGLAAPYNAMIAVRNCSGTIRIEQGVLNGNIANITLGGFYGDNGRQLPYTGLFIQNNTGPVIIDGIESHHHGLDSLIIDGPGLPNVREGGVVRNCNFHNSGRGNSFVGGNGWHFDNTKFDGSAQDLGAMTYTGPGAGLDVEAEGGKWVKNLTWTRCQFIDNHSFGVNAPVDTSGFASTFHFEECKFVGVTGWACWVYAPRVTYERCLFVGAIVGMFPSTAPNTPTSATKFKKCVFDYNAALTPDGVTKPFTNGGELAAAKYMDYTFGDANISFEECAVLCSTDTSSPSPAIFGTTNNRMINCTFRSENSQKSLQAIGQYEGTETLFWNVQTFPDQIKATALFKNYGGPALDSFQWGDDTHALARYAATMDRVTGHLLTYGTGAAPASGTWAKGDRCINNDADSGEFMGHICTVAGTPGTWKGYGAIA